MSFLYSLPQNVHPLVNQFIIPKITIPKDEMKLIDETNIMVKCKNSRYRCKLNIRLIDDIYHIYVNDTLIDFFRRHLVQRNPKFVTQLKSLKDNTYKISELNDHIMRLVDTCNTLIKEKVSDFFSILSQEYIATLFKESQINYHQINLNQMISRSCAHAENTLQYIDVFKSYKKQYPNIDLLPLLSHPSWNRYFTSTDAFLNLFE